MKHIFNFKARFIARIEARTKQQTIRAERKRMPVVGDDLRLQGGDRFHPVLVGWADALIIEPVRIDVPGGIILLGDHRRSASLPLHLDRFAVLDGFDDWAGMRLFWRETHPDLPVFSGFRTFWGESFRKAAA